MINIVEILKNMPIGTKLYSTICGECIIKKIYEGLGFDVISKDGTTYNFSYDGRFNLNGECCIFPSKENRDWNTFNNKIEIPFEPKIGDVVVDSYDNVFIYQGKYSEYSDNSNFVVFTNFHNGFFVTEGNSFQMSKAVRYATTNEEKLLFDIMNKKGYVYNELTNRISKKEEVKRKFKVGDKIMRSNTLYPILTVTFVNNMVYTVKSNISGEEHDISIKIVENCYKIATFSPNDLNAFDRLLVKRHNTWQIAHFGYFKNGVIFTEMGQPCNIDVVPYNDETKHLLSTCDEYDGFYKWWN